ncbi:VWA domain-containing protein [Streptomyces sp. MMG1533]|uniref:VWA domain-containing protein n=1 Tax=Streptomyces sp. MMG1533 TaxID=1415546 RepID=UPI0006ADF629|nr:VWA domain-containing protein [Streptomyces sp. MMG1533]
MTQEFRAFRRVKGRSARPSPATPPPRRRAPLRLAALLASALLAAGLPLLAATEPAGATPAQDPSAAAAIAPIDFAIAVDESTSLSDADMLQERDAAERIALGDVSADSTVDIFGFASADEPPQHAVDTPCPQLKLDSIGRAQVGACTAKLKIRAAGTGTGTDFPAAIRQGVADLKDGAAGTPRVLFMLTDGHLDVEDSSSYGDEAHREAEGRRQLAQALDEARAARVQIWPLGFGSDVDEDTLRQMAEGGYQQSCPGIENTAPTARDVDGSADVGAALERAFASAHCLHHEKPTDGAYPPTTQHVHISAVATVGAIVVSKGDKAVNVTYTDPDGRQLKPGAPVSGTFNGSKYDLAGQGETVESLRLTDPVPGDWTVRIDAPAGHRRQLASVSVLWHGELRTSITLDPPNPQPGGTAKVTLQLLTRKDTPITDPEDLKGMRVKAALIGSGFTDRSLKLADDGSDPDDEAGDGAFTGTASIPSTADGAIRATATLSAIGLAADPDRSEGGHVSFGEPPVSSRLVLTDAKAHPGDSVQGTLELRNNSKQAHTLQVSVRNTAGRLLTAGPSSVSLAAGEARSVPLELEVADSPAFKAAGVSTTTRLGGALTVTDRSAGGGPLSQNPLSVSITPTPTFMDEYGGVVGLAATVLLVLVAAVVLALRLRIWNRMARGLRLELSLPDGTPLSTLPAGRASKGNWFEFKVVDKTGEHPTLAAGPGGGYAVRRDPRAGVLLRTAGEGEQPLTRGRMVTLDIGQDRTLRLSLAEGGSSQGPKPGGWLQRLLGRRTPTKPTPATLPGVAGSASLDDDFDPFL